MTEKFEQPNLGGRKEEKSNKGPFETEALPKIEKLQKRREFPFSRWDLIADFPFPSILSEERAALEKKWRDVDIAALSNEDHRLKEYSEDRHQIDEKLEKFMKQKSPQEILERAKESFRGHLQKGATATSVDGLMRGFHQGYEVARLFLTKSLMEEAAQSCLSMMWHRIKEIDANDPGKTQLMTGVLSLRGWFPDVRINLRRFPEKAGTILAYLLTEGALSDENKEKLFDMLVATRKIKTKTVIVERDALGGAAKEELRSLIGAGKKEEVIMAANFLEKNGVLDLDKDADFFEAITEKER